VTVLVVAAHPDDEALGCGGTMARLADEGERIHVLFVADGVSARGQSHLDTGLEARRAAALRAMDILGAAPPIFLDFPDNRLDTVPLLDITQSIEGAIDTLKPRCVYTHHHGDLNIDHRIVHQAVLTACRPLPGSTVAAIYGFETLSSTEWEAGAPSFDPRRWVDIGRTLERKIAALEAYREEMRPFPHARSIENVRALAMYRGATVGRAAAEAFSVIREIV